MPVNRTDCKGTDKCVAPKEMCGSCDDKVHVATGGENQPVSMTDGGRIKSNLQCQSILDTLRDMVLPAVENMDQNFAGTTRGDTIKQPYLERLSVGTILYTMLMQVCAK